MARSVFVSCAKYFAFLAVIIIYFGHVESSTNTMTIMRQTTIVKREAMTNCEQRLFERVMDCCDVPILFPLSGYQNCSSGLIKSDQQIMRMLSHGFSTYNVSQTRANTNVTRTKTVNFRAITGGRQCIYECIFKNQELLNASGLINAEKMASKVLGMVSAAWKPVLQAAFTECATSIASKPIANMTSQDGTTKSCNPTPLLFMACIYRHNFINCPTTNAFNGGDCKNDLQKMKNCDLFTAYRQ